MFDNEGIHVWLFQLQLLKKWRVW